MTTAPAVADSNGTPLNVSTKSAPGTWIKSSNAGGNTAQQLSQQLAATLLDVEYLGLNPAQTVYFPSSSSVSCAGLGNFFTIQGLINATKTSLAAAPLGNACQSSLTTALDNLNNNRPYYIQVSAASCPLTSPY